VYNIGFVIEQALGHVTHGKNLQANVPKDPEVRSYWALVPWETQGWAARLPVYRSNWTVRAGWRARRMVAQIARQVHLDAILFHTQVPAVLSANWLRRIPGVVSLDATPRQYDELGEFYGHAAGPAWLERLKWRLNRDALAAARHVVTWTAWTKAGVVADYETPAEKVTVIPPGVNVRDWLHPDSRAGRGRGRHDEPVKILFVGGDLERKGGLLLLEAFRTLRAATASATVELHLATRATLPPEPGLFVYNNMQPNSAPLKQLYFDSDIFCLPTYGDCLPMVLSEAGAAGLPAVATAVAGIPEIIQEGETGYLVPRGDVPALTAALARLVADADLRLRMGSRAVEIVSAGFDAERNTFRLLDLLKEVARG
jgi:glycosyltransferase involved in cell wall biosynthesis